MSPYRARKDRPALRDEEKPGLVADMVRQFADPYAFLRELVQNSMDAGTTRVEVDVIRGADGDTRTRVSDSGTGMTPDIIESALLTLFSSSKEGDSTKIGKSGVGFISVLAIAPEAVIVDTWREGGAWRLPELVPPPYRSDGCCTAAATRDLGRFASVADSWDAQVAVRAWSDDPTLLVIETTLCGRGSFDNACAAGTKRFQAAQKSKKPPEVVDVREWRPMGISPVPR